MNPRDTRHFFASSIGEWRVGADLKKLMRAMDKSGFAYNLWLVPGNADDDYEIENYKPVVEGATYLTTIHPKTK